MNALEKKHAALGIHGRAERVASLLSLLHFVVTSLPFLMFVLPPTLVWKHLLHRAPIARLVGRPVLADAVVRFTRYFLGHAGHLQARVLFDRSVSYNMINSLFGQKGWVTVLEHGFRARVIAPPNTSRAEDEVCLLFVHGGAFTTDTGANGQIFWHKLAHEMNSFRKIQFSIVLVDYELSPEHQYPSAIIETLAAYHHLVNEFKIPESRICLAGDSAGGNIAAALMLHLARPNPYITVPAAHGPTPGQPGSALLISPFISLVSSLPSRQANIDFDYIDPAFCDFGALDYVGGRVEYMRNKPSFTVPSFNPIHIFTTPYPDATDIKLDPNYTSDGKGLALLSSPYANPSRCKDLEWWKEACPQGRTMVTWGGKEMLRDDIIEFVDILDEAGVEPVKLIKEFGAHDWVLLDELIPGVWKTNSLGKDRKKNFALKSIATFLQDSNDLPARAAARSN